MRPVDTSRFQFGLPSDSDPEFDPVEERRLLDIMTRDVRASLERQRWTPPIEDLLLAFGLGGVIALFLVRFQSAAMMANGDRRDEMWVVDGDLPLQCFTTDCCPTRAEALSFYCDQAEKWADAVLAREDLSDCWDMGVEPTDELARMLKWRAAFIRREFIPIVEEAPGFHMRPRGRKDFGPA